MSDKDIITNHISIVLKNMRQKSSKVIISQQNIHNKKIQYISKEFIPSKCDIFNKYKGWFKIPQSINIKYHISLFVSFLENFSLFQDHKDILSNIISYKICPEV